MENTLVVQENKETKEKFKKFYKEKIIDTKIAENAEKALDVGTKITKTVDKVKIIVADIALTIFAPEGLCLMPLINGLVNAKNKLTEFGKNKFIEGKRYFEAKYIKADGSCQDVIIPETNKDEVKSTISDLTENIKEIININNEEIKEGGRTR